MGGIGRLFKHDLKVKHENKSCKPTLNRNNK